MTPLAIFSKTCQNPPRSQRNTRTLALSTFSDLGRRPQHVGRNPFDFGNAHCPKFNLVGKEEVNNLEIAQIIADAQGKPLNYELVDFHSSRPGHDLRYALSGEYMRKLGWEPRVSLRERLGEVVEWTLKNDTWLKI